MDAYDPGADLRLDEKRLAAELGVSRTPVREALARLEHQGLVTILPRRGVYVARKSKAEIIEMIIAWAALEGMAARLMCERASDEEISSLRTLFSTFEEAELRSHLDEYSAANLRFHQRLIELGHSPLIANMADSLLVHVRAIRRHTIGEADRAERSIVDHMQIIEALEAREARSGREAGARPRAEPGSPRRSHVAAGLNEVGLGPNRSQGKPEERETT